MFAAFFRKDHVIIYLKGCSCLSTTTVQVPYRFLLDVTASWRKSFINCSVSVQAQSDLENGHGGEKMRVAASGGGLSLHWLALFIPPACTALLHLDGR